MRYKDLDAEGRRLYNTEWCKRRYHRNRADWFSDHPVCVDCGSTERLEVDHVTPLRQAKRVDVWGRSKEYRAEALKDCVARCYSCHKKRSAAQCKEWYTVGVVHGTLSGYLKYKCRCVECVEVKRSYFRARLYA